MNYQTILAIWIWGFLWAISRAYITQIMKNFSEHFPFWTLTANVLWSLIIGIMFGIFFYYSVHTHIKSLVVTGFLWALTTFSTFAMESFFFLDEWEYLKALGNIFANIVLTILFVAIWFYLTKIILK